MAGKETDFNGLFRPGQTQKGDRSLPLPVSIQILQLNGRGILSREDHRILRTDTVPLFQVGTDLLDAPIQIVISRQPFRQLIQVVRWTEETAGQQQGQSRHQKHLPLFSHSVRPLPVK